MEDTIKIALCDDEEMVENCFKKLLKNYMEQKNLAYEFYYYKTGKQFLENAEQFSIVFLDVEMPEINGFQIAEILRKKKLEIEIIYLTNHGEMARQAFKVRALRYLQKPCKKEEWIEALEAALYEISRQSIIKVKKTDENICFIETKKMEYIESLGDDTCIYCLGNKYIISKNNLKYWEEQLKDDFFRCHKSYLVNLGAVKSCINKKFILESGKQVPISYRKKKAAELAIIQYRKEKARFY